MAELLSDIAIQRDLGSLPGWARRGDVLTRLYSFRNFTEAMSFVNRVADAAEAANHHPDIDIRYSTVTLTLSTHDAGGITQNDVDLAKAIDGRRDEDSAGPEEEGSSPA
ncbi:MAG TPA: 4a-hydroxytetrahydrobiopterin dehydratase [Gemmatimonadaceae bacterium]|nr:4a-hydroxytetrahydrobiopterin dehydratase [Gemmatimonadaceae bacterium]